MKMHCFKIVKYEYSLWQVWGGCKCVVFGKVLILCAIFFFACNDFPAKPKQNKNRRNK